MDKDTEEYLRILNKQNEMIAATEKKEDIQPDSIRVQRDQERREKWGQLRAREKRGKRPNRVEKFYT
jgi:hypothetical protein